VARTKDQSLAERNRRICTYRRNGFTYSEIAGLEGVSRARVAQIVAETTPELPEDDSRAEIASLLEYAERKCVDLIEHPGYILTATGRIAEDPETGEPLANKSVVVDALKTVILVAEKRSRLYGTDKQVQKQLDRPTAEAAMWAALAVEKQKIDLTSAERRELEALRRRAAVIPGEVMAELPPGS
jgi:transcriptional regulator with XRE-family HTH domain